jgi:hypothetical protein
MRTLVIITFILLWLVGIIEAIPKPVILHPLPRNIEIQIEKSVLATSNYTYGKGEYVCIANGVSTTALYYIATHGEGDLGYDNWHLYLMDTHTHKMIQRLPEPKEAPLDTAAEAYVAEWNADSTKFNITYRTDRHSEVKSFYKIVNGKAQFIETRVFFPDSIVPIPTP